MIDFDTKMADIIHKNLDTDYIDIKRNGIEIYSNIRCNIEIVSTDVADNLAVDVVPIITSLRIHMPQYVDIRNNDYIIAKKMSSDNRILQVYGGVCGYPSVNQARKSVSMTMNTLKQDDDVTPPIPIENVEVIIKYLDTNNSTINPDKNVLIYKLSPYTINPAQIDGYVAQNCYLNEVLQETLQVTLQPPIQDGNIVKYVYSESVDNVYLRILSKGIYTKDNGSIANGYHLYKKIPIIAISGENGNYTIVTDIIEQEHDDNGLLEIKKGTIIKLFNGNEFVKVATNPARIQLGYEFTTQPYDASTAEQNAYVTNWYEV